MSPNTSDFPYNLQSQFHLPENLALGNQTPEQYIRGKLVTEFYLPSDIRSFLHKYYLLHWTGEYFQNLYYRSGPWINHQDNKYLVVWQDSDCRPVLAASKVQLSFRKLYQDDIHGYVIVKAAPAETL